MPSWLDFAPKPRPLEGGDEWTVFLSYRSVDRRWVINLYDVLTKLGHKVFLDQTALKPGDELRPSIGRALKRSQAGVLVWSRAAGTSDWVRREYDTMLNLRDDKPGFCFVPIRISDEPMPDFVDLNIFLDFTNYPDGPNGAELMRLLHAAVGQPLSAEAARFAAESDEAAKETALSIAAHTRVGRASAGALRRMAEEGGLHWESSAVLAGLAIEALVKIGANDDALAVAEIYEMHFPKAVRVKQMKALALARRAEKEDRPDDLFAAQLILNTLYVAGHRDPETCGILARTYMDLFEVSRDIFQLEQSRELYNDAFEAVPTDYYVGINAAAKSVFLQRPADLARGRQLADRIEALVGAEPVSGDYWKTATIAEVQLIKGNYDAAADLYAKATRAAPGEHASHRTTRRQAVRLMKAMKSPPEACASVLSAFAHLDG